MGAGLRGQSTLRERAPPQRGSRRPGPDGSSSTSRKHLRNTRRGRCNLWTFQRCQLPGARRGRARAFALTVGGGRPLLT